MAGQRLPRKKQLEYLLQYRIYAADDVEGLSLKSAWRDCSAWVDSESVPPGPPARPVDDDDDELSMSMRVVPSRAVLLVRWAKGHYESAPVSYETVRLRREGDLPGAMLMRPGPVASVGELAGALPPSLSLDVALPSARLTLKLARADPLDSDVVVDYATGELYAYVLESVELAE